MRRWILLTGAIVAEVIGTLALRAAVEQPWWIAAVAIAYVAAFACLGFTLRAGMPVGVAYGIWGAAGVALIALLGVGIFGESLSPQAIVGIVVIIVGVVVVESGSGHLPARTDGEGTI